MNSLPLISIGVPIYNAEKTIAKTLSSLIAQDYPNIQILISDNCSTDNSLAICEQYQKLSDRIRIVYQSENIGPIRNFEYVLKHSDGIFFMWCAGDDYLSPSSVRENFDLLNSSSTAVGCSSINSFEGQSSRKYGHELNGDLASRIEKFFRYKREIHGNFYCLFRRSLLLDCGWLSKSFIGWDWAVVFFLILKGDLIRSHNSEVVFGVNGMSRKSTNLNSVLGISDFWFFLPYLTFSIHIWGMLRSTRSLRIKLLVIPKLVFLNLSATKGRLIARYLGSVHQSMKRILSF